MALIIKCSFKRCGYRVPIHKAIERDGKHYCQQTCLDLHLASAGEEVSKPSFMSQGFFNLRVKHFPDEDSP